MSDDNQEAFGGSPHNKTFASLVLISSVFAAFSSVTVIFLIHKMGLKNGHILLIWTMSWFQLLYDVSFFNAVVQAGSSGIYFAANIAQQIGGISGSLTSNFIALITLYVVRNTRSVDIFRYYPHILIIVVTPAFVDVTLYCLSTIHKYYYLRDIATMKVYYYIRLVSIFINFLLSIQTAIHIHRMSNKLSSGQRTVHEKAIRTLAMRLIYYPIVQAISRSGCAWYEMVYNFDFDPSHATENQFIAQCFVAILTPSASVGYLIIFLIMQPHAYECFLAMLCCRVYDPRTKQHQNKHPNHISNNTLSNQSATKLPALHAVSTSTGPVIQGLSYSNFHSVGLHSSGHESSLLSASNNGYYRSESSYTDGYSSTNGEGLGNDIVSSSSRSSVNCDSFGDKEDEELWNLVGKLVMSISDVAVVI